MRDTLIHGEKQLAKELGICERLVRDWIRAGMPVIRVRPRGQVSASKRSIHEWLRTHETTKQRGPER